MKYERKAKSERDQFFLFLPPSAFILPPCFSALFNLESAEFHLALLRFQLPQEQSGLEQQ
jgi:hypothetical protein